jgi:hypothetical protein
VAAHDAAVSGNPVRIAAYASTGAPTGVSDGDTVNVWCDTNGRVQVTASQSGSWSVTGFGGTFPVTDSGGSLTVDAPVATPVFVRLSDGSAAISTLPVSLASLPALVAGTANIGDVDVLTLPALPTGTNSIGTVQPGNTANTTPWLTSDQAATSGGITLPYSFLSTAAVQAAAIKASAGQVYALHFFNLNAAAVYVRLYNQTGSPGTGDTVVYRALIPGNTAGAGFVVPIPPGVAFTTGIGIRVTAAVADNDNTALAANTVMGNVFYK